MSEFVVKQYARSPLLCLLSLKVFSKRKGPEIQRQKPGAAQSSGERPTKVQKGLTASPSMTFGTGEVQGKPAKPQLGLRRRKKKKRVQQEESEDTKITPTTTAADMVSKQEAGNGVFEIFKHNSPSSPESEGNEMQGYEKEADKD